jgi:hypothetical protein
MNYKALFQKLYVVLVVLLAVVVHLAEPIEVEATTGDASGTAGGEIQSFGFNNPTIISGVQIMDASGVNVITSGADSVSLTRLQEFVLQFDVYDLDGFSHLDVYIALFNLDSASAMTDSGVLDAVIDSGLSDTSLVIRWMAPERSLYLSGLSSGIEETFEFPIISGQDNFYVKSGISPINSGTYNSGLTDFIDPSVVSGAVTWEVASGLLFGAARSSVLQSGVFNEFDGSGTTVINSGVLNFQYRVQIPIRLSKVAPSSGVWNLGVMIHDRLQQEIDTPRTDDLVKTDAFAPTFYKNQWYGEVSIVTANPAVNFGIVRAGSADRSISLQSGLEGIEFRFISNGAFNQQATTDSTWVPSVTVPNRPQFAYLVSSSGLNSNDGFLVNVGEGNRFSIEVRRTVHIGVEETGNAFVSILPKTDDTYIASNAVPARSSSTIYRLNREGNNSAQIQGLIGTISTGDDRTSEVGITSQFEFGLRLSPLFLTTSTTGQTIMYSGNISIGISNEAGFFSGN